MTITDRDREAADRALALGLRMDRESVATLIADTRAQAREEGRAELDAERAAHAKTSGTLALLVSELAEACGWEDKTPLHAALHAKNAVLNLKADVAAERHEITALKARLALAEAVCESCDEEWDDEFGEFDVYDHDALAAWWAGK